MEQSSELYQEQFLVGLHPASRGFFHPRSRPVLPNHGLLETMEIKLTASRETAAEPKGARFKHNK
jgi:hypothetical protein